MSVLQKLVAAFGDTRKSIAAIDEKLVALKLREEEILGAMPHTDDVIACFRRGLDQATNVFEEKLHWYWSDEALKRHGPVFIDNAAPQLLALGTQVPEQQNMLPPSNLTPEQQSPVVGTILHVPNVDLACLVHFIRPLIEAELPRLVEKVMPGAKNGMRASERKQALAEVRPQIDKLLQEREAIAAEIEAARAAIDQ